MQLSDGTIVDSGSLPPGSLQGHPVTMSGGTVMDSGASGVRFAEGGPGHHVMDEQRSFEVRLGRCPHCFSERPKP